MIALGDPFRVLDIVQIGACAGAVLAAGEFLFLRDEFGAERVFGWPQLGRVVSTRRFPWSGRWMASLMQARGVLLVVLGRLVGALLLLVPACSHSSVLLALVLVCSLLLIQRLPYGMEGSDQLAAITFTGLLLARSFPGSVRVTEAVLWFLSLQAILAYLMAGIVKLREPGWRDGTLLQGVLGTEFYGHRTLAAALGAAGRARIAIWLVIAFELAMPAVFFSPPVVVMAMLALGLLFHLSLALAMGLNAFVWTFGALYPAIYYCAAGQS